MEKLFAIIIIVLYTNSCFAQDELSRSKERNIRTTNLYLYSEATAETPKEATKLAKKILISKIFDFEPALINNSEHIEKIIENSDQYLIMERGSKFRSIAFCLKSDIQNLIKSAPLNVSIDQIDKHESSNGESTEKKDDLHTVNITLIKSDTLAIVQPKKEEAKKDSLVIQKAVSQNCEPSSPLIVDFLNGKELLQYILTIDNAHKLGKLFDIQKQKGMLIYGGKASLSFPDKSYIVFYSRDGAIKAYLDKGNLWRKNLVTGEMESMNLYKDNLFIWFQLMN